jgi:membrane protein YdbS with pleckstrin-like domain
MIVSSRRPHNSLEAMALSRLLKTNLVLLVLVLIAIIVSFFAVYAGNKRFIGIIGIAVLALALVLWRIFSLTRQTAATSEPETLSFDFDIDSIQKNRPPYK